MIKIILINEESPYIEKAIELGNQNKATLGLNKK